VLCLQRDFFFLHFFFTIFFCQRWISWRKVISVGANLSPVGCLPVSRRQPHHFLTDLGSQLLLRLLEVVRDLQIEPRLRIAPEVTRQPQRGIERDTAAFERDVVDARGGNAQNGFHITFFSSSYIER
jgi:hypothetical protein